MSRVKAPPDLTVGERLDQISALHMAEFGPRYSAAFEQLLTIIAEQQVELDRLGGVVDAWNRMATAQAARLSRLEAQVKRDAPGPPDGVNASRWVGPDEFFPAG